MAKLGNRNVHKIGDGYEVSVIDYGYGSDQGLYEAAILYKGEVTHIEVLTGDDSVIGWLSAQDVVQFVQKVRAYVLVGIDPTTGLIKD